MTDLRYFSETIHICIVCAYISWILYMHMFIQIYLGTCYQYIQIVSKNILHIRMYVKCWAFYKKKHLIIQLNQHLIQVESIYKVSIAPS